MKLFDSKAKLRATIVLIEKRVGIFGKNLLFKT